MYENFTLTLVLNLLSLGKIQAYTRYYMFGNLLYAGLPIVQLQ